LQQWYAIKNVGSWLTVIMPMTSEENMAWWSTLHEYWGETSCVIATWWQSYWWLFMWYTKHQSIKRQNRGFIYSIYHISRIIIKMNENHTFDFYLCSIHSLFFNTVKNIGILTTYPIYCIVEYGTIFLFLSVLSPTLGLVTSNRCYSPHTTQILIVLSPTTSSITYRTNITGHSVSKNRNFWDDGALQRCGFTEVYCFWGWKKE
jgi:hypothetical protein